MNLFGQPAARNPYTRWQDDPVGFCQTVFGEHYTDGIAAVMRSVRENQVTIAKSANAVGKTHGAARVALWFYKCFPNAQVYTTSAPPERNLRRLLWGEIGHVAQAHPELFKGDRIRADMAIERNSLSFVVGVPIPSSGTSEQREAKFSGKHAPEILFIVDEGDAVPYEVYKGIESCMSGGLARLLVMFNPRADVGHVANLAKRGEGHVVSLSAFEHPNVISGSNVIPGAVTRSKTVQRINKWSRALAPGELADVECFQLPEFLEGATANNPQGGEYTPLPAGWRRVTDPSFFYMVLGIYPPQSETQLISRAWIDAAVSRWLTYTAQYGESPPYSLAPLAGLDVAEYGKDANVLIRRHGGWVSRCESWSGLDPDSTAIKAAELLARAVPAYTCMVDATGIGAGVPARMTRLGTQALGVKVGSAPTEIPDEEEIQGEFFLLRDQLWWKCREWLRRDGGAMLPPDDDLAQELSAPTYRIHNGKIRVTSKDTLRELLGRSPDRADALCLTFAESDVEKTTVRASPLNGYRG